AELAVPVLERLGVPAIFFVAGRPLAERRALYVHKVHALRESVPDAELLRLAGADDVSAEVAQEHYSYDEPDAARLKYLLNMALPLEEREALVGEADRKSTRLNSSHRTISYAVFCLKKKQ